MNIDSKQVMIIDDDVQSLRSLTTFLRTCGFKPPMAINDPSTTLDKISQERPDVIFLDLHMPGVSGLSLLEAIKQKYPEIEIIIITADDQIEMAVKCTQLGAYDYFVKPIDQKRLIHVLKKALEGIGLHQQLFTIQERLLSGSPPTHPAFSPILTRSPNMECLFKFIEAISTSTRPVLILGETGTGKELFAKAVHDVSTQAGDFVAVNIAGFDNETLSDNLFGHKKGAFTGAQDHRKGLINKAQSGTLFLDEIGDLNPQSQIKLLRLLQENNYYPLGSDSLEKNTARIITATHQNLESLIDSGEFRRDLFFRLQLHTIKIPPLRERLEDIPLLVEHFLVKACKELSRPLLDLPSNLFDLLAECSFPGNIRELEMLIFDAVIYSRGSSLETDQIQNHLDKDSLIVRKKEVVESACTNPFPQMETLPTIKEATNYLIDEALIRTQNNQKEASTSLGITRQALNKRLTRRSKDKTTPVTE